MIPVFDLTELCSKRDTFTAVLLHVKKEKEREKRQRVRTESPSLGFSVHLLLPVYRTTSVVERSPASSAGALSRALALPTSPRPTHLPVRTQNPRILEVLEAKSKRIQGS